MESSCINVYRDSANSVKDDQYYFSYTFETTVMMIFSYSLFPCKLTLYLQQRFHKWKETVVLCLHTE